MNHDIALKTIAGLIALAAAVSDLRTHRIPNPLICTGTLLGLLFHAHADALTGLLFSLKGLGVGLGIWLIPYALGAMGAGDVKLMAAVGALLGARDVVHASLYGALFGGMYALGVFLWRKPYRERFGLMIATFFRTGRFLYIPAAATDEKVRLCYAVALAAGTFTHLGLDALGFRLF
ncbi:MAG: A24 family peptidase [Desulfosoma sp.]